MQQTKFRRNRSPGSGEEIVEGFLPYKGRGSHLGRVKQSVNKRLFPLPMNTPHKICV